MNIYKFSEDKDFDKEYTYKVLVYPNITYMKDLEKDSYVVVLGNIIKEMNKIRDDLDWTILSPELIPSLEFDNTEQTWLSFFLISAITSSKFFIRPGSPPNRFTLTL